MSETPIIESTGKNARNGDMLSLNGHRHAYSLNGIKTISKADLGITLDYAATLERAREPILIHDSFDEMPQRFVNCLNPDSYVRPHMHVVPNQWELMCWLSGKILALFFNEQGKVIRKILMSEEDIRVIEIPPFSYHSFIAFEKSAYLEIRNCKYQPVVDRVYATWSPPEKDPFAQDYQKRFLSVEVGDFCNC